MRKSMQNTNPNFSSESRDIKWLKFLNFHSQFCNYLWVGTSLWTTFCEKQRCKGLTDHWEELSDNEKSPETLEQKNDMIWFMGSVWLSGWEYTTVMAGARPEARTVISNLMQYSRSKIIEAWIQEVVWVLNSSQILYTFWKLTGFVVKLEIRYKRNTGNQIAWATGKQSCHQMKWEKLQEDHVCWTSKSSFRYVKFKMSSR